ncbi:DUF4394 domain-containing protein [Marinomonas sp. A79]|uniref:DUF4394 domain-containing protein n=1 Tax=Marinomonas vulgaris TaxID=2823372 RepID=A0ABS5HC88_9GAMM|nr:DUF4394 domain-containing protein [Marinomonas vulgaris]MBR7889272.1 DUF4394 domain-containing protein [Marinomonas vulgaris]
MRKASAILLSLPILTSVLMGCAHSDRAIDPVVSIPHLAPDAVLPETLFALFSDNTLLKFNAAHPDVPLAKVSLVGLNPDESLLGIDYRVAYGVLYSVSNTGQVYTINTDSGQLTAIGEPSQGVAIDGERYGVDFNPAADRIRLVTDAGTNMRMHPETGLFVDNNADESGVQLDGALQYSSGDVAYGKAPHLRAAAYTYNTTNSKLTTNFAIDAVQGTLVTQGSRETDTNPVSPNTGQLYTVGALATGPVSDAHFDIADVTNAAYVALAMPGDKNYTFYQINLDNAALLTIGALNNAELGSDTLVGIAIEP